MWNYVHQDVELTAEEHAHVLECPACLALFKLCLKARNVEEVDFDSDSDLHERRSA
jgi:hypothetical protein